MRRRRTTRERADLGPCCTRALEELVRTVAAIDGPRAAEMLSGLSGTARPRALELLRLIQEGSRPERHARLAGAFAPGPQLLARAEGIPGPLGVGVRAALTRGASPQPAWHDSRMARWARRLLLELGDEDPGRPSG